SDDEIDDALVTAVTGQLMGTRTPSAHQRNLVLTLARVHDLTDMGAVRLPAVELGSGESNVMEGGSQAGGGWFCSRGHAGRWRGRGARGGGGGGGGWGG